MLVLCASGPAAADQQRRIALTFDDAPRGAGPLFSGVVRTQRIVDHLDAGAVEGALFFVTTANLEREADGRARLVSYVEAGHRLANHSHSHPWLWKTGVDDYLADVDRASEVLATFDGVAPYFRYPYLDEGRTVARRDAVRAGLAERGLRNGHVTVDNYDWFMNALLAEAVRSGRAIDEAAWCSAYTSILIDGIEFYDRIARETLGRSPQHVLLLHENDLAALCLDDLIAALKDGGWAFVPAETAFGDPIAAWIPDTLFNGQGRVAALAAAAGQPLRTLVHESEDEAWLRRRFQSLGLLSEPTRSDAAGKP
ncbi:polysaccharide deacetylase family protein [Wenzhouxiangella sp. XN79A]|uniref:polysaccharide deacetylase family protein n=1 Tax=Wenzhouxiangella sp. XN79A TaxID=2724193 RepID=UPI001F0D2CCD|nr:polysaccharide deacetylase family protein [Wenzhouxiangella sp. XN79A]